MKKVFFSICLMLISASNFAQAPDWLWAKSAVGTGHAFANSLAVDFSGNSYVVGDFVDGILTFGSTTLTNAGARDIFLVKYDKYGNVIWAKSAGGTNYDAAKSVTVDASGNIYVTGFFLSDTIFFGSNILINMNIPGYTDDIFLAKYDTNGNLLWVKSAGGMKDDAANSVMVDVSGNAIVAGWFESTTITFDSTTLTNTDTTFIVPDDIFLAKYDTSGNALWARSAGGTKSDRAYSVTVDNSGNIYVAGDFLSDLIKFGSTTLTNSNHTNNTTDLFLAKYNANGNLLWVKSADGAYDEVARSVTTDASGNIYIAGDFNSSTLTFDTITLTNIGIYNIFIAKYDPSGNILWAKSAGGTGYDYEPSVAVDSSGNAYVTGNFRSSTLTFGSTTLTNAGNSGTYDLFIAKYNPDGNILWAKRAGGTSMDMSYSIAVNTSGNTFVAGYFQSSTIAFDTTILTSTGWDKIFIAKLDSSLLTGINELSNLLDISVFPNPSADNITIIIPQKAIIEILNIEGQIIETIKNDEIKTTIDLEHLSCGVYIIRAITDKGIATRKLIKQ